MLNTMSGFSFTNKNISLKVYKIIINIYFSFNLTFITLIFINSLLEYLNLCLQSKQSQKID